MAKKIVKKKVMPVPKRPARHKAKRTKRARRSKKEIISASKPANTNARPHRTKGRLSTARRKQLAFARKKKFERQVTEKTLRDILALRCVQRCTHP
ncbi:MAG: hypothetical protein ACOY0T_28560 [Myxococcota bacterium]